MKRQCADGAWPHAGYARMTPANNPRCAGFIPIPSHEIPWTGTRFAQLRVHSERIALGIWVNLFHASQHASMMSS
jgi:hypothetical protein